MNSRLRALGGMKNYIRVSELQKDKHRSGDVCMVHFMDDSIQGFRVNKQDTGQVLLDMVYSHLGVMEKEYFGLLYTEESVTSPRWLEAGKLIRKQLKGGFPCSLHFRVRFFVPDPNLLQQEQTRHLYFLQLKSDILEGRLSCPMNSAVVLASYAVQSEIGDHIPDQHHPGYLSDFSFLPDQNEDFLTKVESLHEQHRGLSQSEAESCYINTARTLDFYGVELHGGRDLHDLELSIGICSGGIAVYRKRICTSFYNWGNIVKISFKRKKFFIHLKHKQGYSRENVVSFNIPNYRACKNLWKSCVEHHTFFQFKKSLSQDKRSSSNYWTISAKSQNKTGGLNSQFCKKVMGGMVWNSNLRRSLSAEHLETKSLPSRSPPMTPNWRSPRMRHEMHKPHHSSFDNLASEMAYITETEDVFYTYKGSLNSKDSDTESTPHNSIRRRSSERDSLRKGYDSSSLQTSSERTGDGTVPSSPNGMSNVAVGPNSLEGVTTLSEDLNGSKMKMIEDSRKDRNSKNLAGDRDLLLIRITPDKDGKFGFNLKGGADQKMPLVVSRVTPDSPADICTPALREGDQIVLINGRDISEHTHDQVVMFIKASRESHTKELAVLVRRKVTRPVIDKTDDEADFQSSPEYLPPPPLHHGDTLEESMEQLKRGLESGTVLMQFEQLYKKKPGMSMTCAKLPENMDKNRYKDILPYDDTRVIISGSEDYVNANHVNMEIPSAGIVNRYIASQGPLPSTCAVFWQAVWENMSSLIVMLTTLTERGRTKCHQYWPNPPEVEEYGNFRVSCLSEDCTIAYVFREMTVTNIGTGEERSVTHLQYVAWPDHGVPDDSTDFLDFVTCVRQKRVKDEPVIAHCSAGIGRTGVLITMETAMCLIEKNQPVYPLDIVRIMRDQRAMMVQNSSQYKFVCEAILRVYEESKTQLMDSS
ncbi:tyrosine-protein phosphatase non-receptor type 3 [Protopterus annectens]|uniref:tyrosine-protein phosphatase non-receptor type 3 n=1 Tax=Protopterus annectens TaxID=7888 RepID=UPI001CF9C91E|nr:tyrosine-protein phosphatase non-receptor type 3 [Protopterus annectens]